MAYFAASVDQPDTNRRFAQQLGVDFPILSDPKREAATAYGVVSEGQPFASRWTFYIGADGKILYIDRQVSTATHGRSIADRLARLGVKRRAAK